MKNKENLSEAQIRPLGLVKKQKKFLLHDIKRLQSKSNYFIFVNCPGCNSRKFKLIFSKNKFRYVECQKCKTFFMNPRPAPKILEWFYKESVNYKFWNDFIFPASENARREKIIIPRIDKLLDLMKKYNLNRNSLIEIGSGFGTFAYELSKRNLFKKIVCVEPTPSLASSCRKRNLEVIESPIEKVKLSKIDLFDIAVSFEVIEHLFSPSKFIGSINKLLKPKGAILIVCPNGQGFDVQVLGKASDTVDHEHLNYFNIESLSLLLIKSGFSILECSTPGRLDADIVRNKILSRKFSISQQSFLKKILLEDWERLGENFQDFLIQNLLSSNMWILARKN